MATLTPAARAEILARVAHLRSELAELARDAYNLSEWSSDMTSVWYAADDAGEKLDNVVRWMK